ncbi:MAG TPA: ABC transporter permease, partial [Gemmatimonadaceae bacterium]
MTNEDRDLDDEIAAHLRMAIEARVARGESRADAERAARREFGNVTHVKEVTRDQRLGLWLERLTQDVRYGLRALRRAPEFTIAAVATLGVAIGANSAVFTVVRSVLLRPLPFAAPEQLDVISYLPTDLPFTMSPSLVDHDWLVYREHQRSFSAVTAYRRKAATLSGRGDAVRLFGAAVDANFFSTFGRVPAIGRTFNGEEESRDEKLALLSDRIWRDRFAADSGVVGRSITLDAESYRVIGVLPPTFTFPEQSDFWTPLDVRLNAGNATFLPVIGRLRGGVPAEQARAELAAFMAAQPRDARDPNVHKYAAEIIPLRDVLTGKVARSLWILSGAVGFVLLVACANVANLLLIRATSRRHEMAVRVAIGAGKLRIIRQLLTESLLLGLGGALLGLVLANVGTRLLIVIAPPGRIPRIDEVHPDAWVFLFTLAIAVVTGIAFGMVPAIQSAR